MRLSNAPVETSAAPQLSVREVNAENVDALMRLEVLPGQRTLISPVARSLAQVAYEPAGSAHALYTGDEPVGLLLLYDARQDKKKPAPQLYLWRLLIDARHQHRGLGRQAVAWVVEEGRRMGMETVGLSHVDVAGHAGGFYEKLGFAYTGEVDGVERKMIFTLAR